MILSTRSRLNSNPFQLTLTVINSKPVPQRHDPTINQKDISAYNEFLFCFHFRLDVSNAVPPVLSSSRGISGEACGHGRLAQGHAGPHRGHTAAGHGHRTGCSPCLHLSPTDTHTLSHSIKRSFQHQVSPACLLLRAGPRLSRDGGALDKHCCQLLTGGSLPRNLLFSLLHESLTQHSSSQCMLTGNTSPIKYKGSGYFVVKDAKHGRHTSTSHPDITLKGCTGLTA